MLYRHQKNLLNENPAKHLLAWGTGTGKTRAALEMAERNAFSVLIICPKALKENWRINARDQFEETKFEYVIISKEEFRKNWDVLPYYNSVIVDEAHYFFGHTSAMHKALYKYCEKYQTNYRWLLTATPYLSTPWNVYAALRLLDYKPNWNSFKRKFFFEIRMGARMVPIKKNDQESQDALRDLILKMGSTVKLDECIDIPEQTFDVEYVTLNPDQNRAINHLNEVNHIARWTAIHQICGGTKKGNEYESTSRYSSQKIDRLKELVHEHERVIVVCRYRAEMEYVAEQIAGSSDTPVFYLHGDIENKHDVIDNLRSYPSYVLVVNAACSEGWELPSCSTMIFYSYDFSLKNYIQMQGRINRINNPKKNFYLSLVVAGSIDEDIYHTIQLKQDFHLSLYKK